MPEPELALCGSHSRNHQIDAPNGAGLLEDVTGGAQVVAACGHLSPDFADVKALNICYS